MRVGLNTLVIIVLLLIASVVTHRLMSRFTQDHPARNGGVLITPDFQPAAILESELTADRQHVHQFTVTNNSESTRECELRNPSCGCLSVLRNGRPATLGESFSLAPGDQQSIGLAVTLPTRGISAASIELHELQQNNLSDETPVHLLKRQIEVLEDIAVEPRQLQIPVRNGISGGLEHVSISSWGRDDYRHVQFELSDGIADAFDLTLCRTERRFDSSRQMFQVSYSLSLNPAVTAGADNTGRVPTEPSSPDQFLVVSAAEDRSRSIAAPIRFTSGNALKAIERLNFAEVRVGAVRSKDVIVLAPRGMEFQAGQVHATPEGLSDEVSTQTAIRSDGRYAVINVEFAPNSPGKKAGVLRITSSPDHDPAQVQIAGVAVESDLDRRDQTHKHPAPE